MDYLTKYYKNLCEQYQEQLDNLKRRAADLKAGEWWGKEVPEDISKQYQNDPKYWMASSSDFRRIRFAPDEIPGVKPYKDLPPDIDTFATATDIKKSMPAYFKSGFFSNSLNTQQPSTPVDWNKFSNILSNRPKPKLEPEMETYRGAPVRSKLESNSSSYVSDNAYSPQNTPAANRESQNTRDMFDRMSGNRPPSYSLTRNTVPPQSYEDQELASKMRQNRKDSLNRMAAGQKEITDIWNEAGERIRKIYAPKPDPSKMTPEQKSEHMARTGDSTEPVKRTTEEILRDAENATKRLRAILDKTKPTESQKKPEVASPTLPPDAMGAIQAMLASAAESSKRMVK